MKIIINENLNLDEPEIIINCNQANEEILQIIANLRAYNKKLTGLKDGKTYILDAKDVLYFDTVDRKTFIYTDHDVFETQLKLYEIEERLSNLDFFRASKSAVINLKKVISLKPEFGGKLEVTLINKEKLLISRQYVSYIKTKLEL